MLTTPLYTKTISSGCCSIAIVTPLPLTMPLHTSKIGLLMLKSLVTALLWRISRSWTDGGCRRQDGRCHKQYISRLFLKLLSLDMKRSTWSWDSTHDHITCSHLMIISPDCTWPWDSSTICRQSHMLTYDWLEHSWAKVSINRMDQSSYDVLSLDYDVMVLLLVAMCQLVVSIYYSASVSTIDKLRIACASVSTIEIC